MLTVEHLIATQKTGLGHAFGAGARAFEGFEQLVELNLQTTKLTLAEAAESARTLLSMQDPLQAMATQGAALQPAFDKASAYGRQAYDIIQATNADIGKIAEESTAEAQKVLASSLESFLKDAPAGTEGAVAYLKSVAAVVGGVQESVQKAVKQATDVAQANVEAVSATAAKASGSRTKRAS